MLFETERLFARRISVDDVEAMFAVYGDVETVRFVGDSQPLSRSHCAEWVKVTDRNFERRGYGMIAFCERGTGEVVGFGGVVHPNQQPDPEVKYALRRDRWGSGYATEAVTGLVLHAKSVWVLGELIATVFAGNEASQRVLSKIGFSRAEDRIDDDGTAIQVWRLG